MSALHYIKVWVKTRPGTELDIHPRREEVGKDDELNLIVWSLFDPHDQDVTFDATGFFEWLDPKPPAGAFAEPYLSPDRKRILMEDLNSNQNQKPGDFDYRLHATGGDGTQYMSKKGDPHIQYDKGAKPLTATNPAIINR